MEFLDLSRKDHSAYFSSFMCPHVSYYFDYEHLPAAGGALVAGSPGCPAPTSIPGCLSVLAAVTGLIAIRCPTPTI